MDLTPLVALAAAVIAAAALTAALFAALAWRAAVARTGSSGVTPQDLRSAVAELADGASRTAETVRTAQAGELSGLRTELRGALEGHHHGLGAAMEAARTAQVGELGVLRGELVEAATSGRREQGEALARMQASLDERVQALTTSLVEQQAATRREVTETLTAMSASNEARLEQMRATVQEKLDATLGERLDASFKVVSERLEKVHQGLGEMQTLAQGVGSLQRTLTNVKTRGAWAELQLEALLVDLLTPEQYQRQFRINPDSSELVDFAVRLPGQSDDTPLWMAIDSKFPMDVYERLQTAWDGDDPEAVRLASRALVDRVKAEAASISSKYVNPPHTTDFAVLYLPTESLFAEVVRNAALVHDLRTKHQVIVAGPTTLTALLGSLSLGFRTLAIQKRSSEAWQVLAQVKTEFEKSAAVWEKLGKQLETAQRTAADAGVRHRAIGRRLRAVETAPLEASLAASLAAVDDPDAEVDVDPVATATAVADLVAAPAGT